MLSRRLYSFGLGGTYQCFIVKPPNTKCTCMHAGYWYQLYHSDIDFLEDFYKNIMTITNVRFTVVGNLAWENGWKVPGFDCLLSRFHFTFKNLPRSRFTVLWRRSLFPMYAQFLLGRALRSQSLSGIFFQNDCLQGNYDVKHIGYTETDLLSQPPTR